MPFLIVCGHILNHLTFTQLGMNINPLEDTPVPYFLTSCDQENKIIVNTQTCEATLTLVPLSFKPGNQPLSNIQLLLWSYLLLNVK